MYIKDPLIAQRCEVASPMIQKMAANCISVFDDTTLKPQEKIEKFVPNINFTHRRAESNHFIYNTCTGAVKDTVLSLVYTTRRKKIRLHRSIEN